MARGKRPVSIPNLEAKARHGDGTALGRVWESSTPPLYNDYKGRRSHAPTAFFHIPLISTRNDTHQFVLLIGFAVFCAYMQRENRAK